MRCLISKRRGTKGTENSRHTCESSLREQQPHLGLASPWIGILETHVNQACKSRTESRISLASRLNRQDHHRCLNVPVGMTASMPTDCWRAQTTSRTLKKMDESLAATNISGSGAGDSGDSDLDIGNESHEHLLPCVPVCVLPAPRSTEIQSYEKKRWLGRSKLAADELKDKK
jgi:hypothetical protein